MSLAVSAVIQPSRILLTMVGAMSLCVALSGTAIASGHAVDLPVMPRLIVGVSLVFLSFFGFYHGVRNRKPIHIDISGTGQIRLAKVDGEAPCADTNWPHVREIGEVIQLMENSTLWGHMLLLRLQAADGSVTIVPVFRDSVSEDSFRALSAAFRWMSTQKGAWEREIF